MGLPPVPREMPGGVVVAQGTLDPLTQVRILAGQPGITYKIGPRITSGASVFGLWSWKFHAPFQVRFWH